MRTTTVVETEGTFAELWDRAQTGSVIEIASFSIGNIRDWRAGYDDFLLVFHLSNEFMGLTKNGIMVSLGVYSCNSWQTDDQGIVICRGVDFFRLTVEKELLLLDLGAREVFDDWRIGKSGLFTRRGGFYHKLEPQHCSLLFGYHSSIESWASGPAGLILYNGIDFGEITRKDEDRLVWTEAGTVDTWAVTPSGLVTCVDSNFALNRVAGKKTYLGYHPCTRWQVGPHGIIIQQADTFSLIVIK